MHIEIRGLSKTYPNGTQALKAVDLDIPIGMFGLLGPNGAGKSTLMRTIATLQEADAGTIRFGPVDVLQHKATMRRMLGYLPQEFGVYAGVSAVDLLHHLAILKGVTNGRERRAMVEHLLQEVNLYEVRHKAVSGYSGGMRQRFGIAQALLGNPRVIVLDEPTAGLDPVERARFLYLLSYVSERAAIILSTHIVEDVSELCPALAIIAGGQVLATGQPLQLMQQLRGRIWQTTVTRAELSAYEQAYRVLSSHFFMGEIVVKVFSEGQPASGFEPAAPDLKDVYFCAMQGWQAPPAVARQAEGRAA
jgi:ABC-type multidrug transport system ATPase subunit